MSRANHLRREIENLKKDIKGVYAQLYTLEDLIDNASEKTSERTREERENKRANLLRALAHYEERLEKYQDELSALEW